MNMDYNPINEEIIFHMLYFANREKCNISKPSCKYGSLAMLKRHKEMYLVMIPKLLIGFLH
jgi:hypothetical protein